ncbi:hypothetical protein [Citricoccus sp. K5]|uniref:phage tail tube protein n=1 Tax=Citricoccus sp. K5 TaxID=2653135 RepID=UPI0012F2879D|nr:hypothetical protein [Citricoccus sp. K5]VXA92371.1 conserved hypothetical protein [Citricoccus sp. K5]VXA94464.1 conserved hypothetical protein [Citricoccus sp. K5]
MTVTPISALPPRTFAEQRRKITVLTAPPTEPLGALTVATLTAGMDAACRVAQEGTRFAATASETLNQPAVCEPSSASVPARSNYEGSIAVFRYFDETNPGAADPTGDVLFQALKVKGTPVYVVESLTGKDWDEEWEAGDEYSVFAVTTDNWQRQADPHAGYIHVTIPLTVQDAELNGVVAGTAGA